MRPPIHRLTVAALVAVVTLAAACGGGSSASPTTRPADPAHSSHYGPTTPTTDGHGTSSSGKRAGNGGTAASPGGSGDVPSGTGSSGTSGVTGRPHAPGPSGTAAPSGAPGSTAAPGRSTGSTTTTGAATAPTGTLPVIAATSDGGFVSPDHRVACLLDINPSDQVRCVSFPTSALVVMTPDGSLTRCSGSSCALGNRSPGYKVLAYGTATGTSAFRCASTTAGITCTARSGAGFTVSGSGLSTIG